MHRIFKYAVRQWKLYLVAIISLVAGVYFSALGPKYIQKIIDTCIVNGEVKLFFSLALPLLAAYLITGLFKYVQEFASDCISAAMQNSMRKETFRSIMAEDQYFFKENNPGELMSRTKQDIETVGFNTGFILIFFIELVIHVIYMTYCLVRINFSSAIASLVFMPIIAVLAIISEPIGVKLSDQRSDDIADMNQSATESLSGIRTVKAFGQEKTETKRFDKYNRRFYTHSLKLDLLWANWTTPMEALARIMLLVSILISGLQVIAGKMTLGELTAVTQYTSELSWPMMEVGWLLTEFASAKASLKKINKILDAKPSIKDGSEHLKKRSGNLEFDHVSLEADGQKILNDVSFKLEEGKTLGIMGATGSGKSTIANLAMRFIDPTSGSVKTQGIDLKDLDLYSARNSKAIVTQDIFLFSDTINANLDKGLRGQIPQTVLENSARDAAAHEFISKLTDGYETIIGEKGVGLSGGQKQRISIARALASGRPLLIFDDATSALDMETEKLVQKAIKKHGNVTMMIIAHRISAVRDADEIIILDHGRVIERGTHNQLMALKGSYYHTYLTQYPDEEIEANSSALEACSSEASAPAPCVSSPSAPSPSAGTNSKEVH